MSEQIYGIDLGTTNSCLSVLSGGQPRVLPIDGNGLVPSVVSLDGAELLVGRRAWNRAAAFPEQTIKSVKRLMGSNEKLRLGEKTYQPEDVSAMILGYLRDEAERLEGLKVRRVVITVPAYFSDAQRRATIEAGQKAGLTVERIINEPTAAALFYDQLRVSGQDSQDGEGRWKYALVYDLGGGTFDVSILRLSEIIEVLASTGDTHLGGDDFDARLTSRLLETIREGGGPDLSQYRPAVARLTAEAEKAKIILSQKGTVHIAEAHIPTPDGRPVTVETDISRGEFEEMTAYLLERTTDFVGKALDEAGIRASDIDRVLLVGGMTRMPAVGQRLNAIFGQAQRPVVDPDLSVVRGAAIQGAIITGENIEQILLDVTAHTLGLSALNARTGNLDCVPIIPRNTPIPAVRSRLFATTMENQKKVELKVYQGEAIDPDQNVLIGASFLELARAEAHCPIEVEYSYDLNGMVHMVAEQKGYSRRTEVRFDSRNPQGDDFQSLDFLDDDDNDDGLEPASPSRAGEGINFITRRARTLLEKISKEENQAVLASLLERYEQALANDSADLDDLEDELLSLMDEI
ncbi:MAG: Hsp70 family protein [Candidatus Adiutrix sp.]|jgi:molecular chaperone DnaK|nr:Hsp70 family protein [Candidatus Adiutrix sp.]